VIPVKCVYVCLCKDALKDFERHDFVRQPCSATSACSVAVEETSSVNRSAVGVFLV